MNSSYLSYNQNDFFWVSVKDQFDFNTCKQFEEPTPVPKKRLGLIDVNENPNDSCNCPSQTPCPSNIDSMDLNQSIEFTPENIKGEQIPLNVDEYIKELCHNYKTSNTLEIGRAHV